MTPVLEPKTQAFINAVVAQGGKPLYQLSYPDARKVLEGAQSGVIAKLPADVEDLTLPAGPGGQVSVTIYRPQRVTGPLPAVMYFHGGGWVLGSKNTHDRLMRDLVNGTQAAFVFVNYTPSPEAQFPVPIEQAYAATKYISENAGQFDLNSNHLAVAGDSVGGNMATAVTLLAKERGGPTIRHQTLFYPVTGADFTTGSYTQFAAGPWLTKPAMEWFWDAYAPNKSDRTKITASPILATPAELKGLPPALVVTDENDVLRDEGEQYARNLMEAGVNVTAVRFIGTFHDFVMLNGLAGTPASLNAIRLASNQITAALSK